MMCRRAWLGALVVGALLPLSSLPLARAEDHEAAKVCLTFKIPDGKGDAVKAAVAKIAGVEDASVEGGTVCFTVAEEKHVMLSQVEMAVAKAAGKEATLDRAGTSLSGEVELDCAGLNKDQTEAAIKAIGGVDGVEKAEKTSSGHVKVTCKSPKGAALADVEAAVMSATKSKEGWEVKDAAWHGPKKKDKKGGSG